ncbi:efflux RND transporter periplasmic adaptor subunit [Novosphingobium sp.]|uniref:efflux RND transporter periplasmic adaptor subunit n=1 Tax=Novosphingobium sp. TaxID=1874826 RepID=UPI0026138386|nr:efflux RND transporter periplasmic adaptor subunit [Novosphingobium sp.]
MSYRQASLRALGFALLLGACSGPDGPQEKPLPVVEAVLPMAGSGSASDGSSFPVRVLYDREVAVSLRLGGTLSALPVHPGDRVAAGALLAAITPTLQAEAERRVAAEVDRLSRAERRNETLLPAGAVSEAQREDTQSALAAARAALRAARYDRASTAARMPFAGLVLARMHEVGETVSPGEPIVRIADLNSPLLARAAVTPAIAMRMPIGTPVRLSLANHGEVTGRLLRKASLADPATGTLDLDFALPSGRGMLSGLTGSLIIPEGSANAVEGRLTIPAEALLDADGKQGHVFVLDPKSSIVRRQAVTLHGFVGDRIAVEGLAPTARVITAGAGFVRDGQKVRVDAR